MKKPTYYSMKKMVFLMSVLLAWTTSLSAQFTREQADAIVMGYLQENNTAKPYFLYVNVNTPNEEGFVITTYKEETVKAKYACWVYFVYENFEFCPTCLPGPAVPNRYLFVKEDTGSLLEIITNNNFAPANLTDWEPVKTFNGLTNQKENNKSLYPNPVDDWLTIPCNRENTRVEIYDLKGTRLFSKELSDKDTFRLNVSFLNAGTYMVNVDGKTHKIIKN